MLHDRAPSITDGGQIMTAVPPVPTRSFSLHPGSEQIRQSRLMNRASMIATRKGRQPRGQNPVLVPEKCTSSGSLPGEKRVFHVYHVLQQRKDVKPSDCRTCE